MSRIVNMFRFFVAPAIFCCVCGPVFSHDLASDGQIGVVMHIDPEDDPIAGSPSVFYFEFKDSAQRFDPSECSGTFSILQNGKIVYSQALFIPGSQSLNVAQSFTFPKTGVYELQLSGTPAGKIAFQPFNISFEIRVARSVGNSQEVTSNGNVSGSVVLGLLAIGATGLVVLIVFAVSRGRPPKS